MIMSPYKSPSSFPRLVNTASWSPNLLEDADRSLECDDYDERFDAALKSRLTSS
jgi:hypothetical protein